MLLLTRTHRKRNKLEISRLPSDVIYFGETSETAGGLKVKNMLHLHKATRNISSLLSCSRNHVRRAPRYISSCTFNVSCQLQQPVGFHSLNLPNLRASPITATFYQKHFSTKGKNDEEADAIEVETDAGNPADFIHTHLPATVAIPEVWPYLPCIATSRNPVFPRFMKILEVSSERFLATLTRILIMFFSFLIQY